MGKSERTIRALEEEGIYVPCQLIQVMQPIEIYLKYNLTLFWNIKKNASLSPLLFCSITLGFIIEELDDLTQN